MKNFRNYLYCNSDYRAYGKVYHDSERKQAVFTDGRFMIISKELYDSSKDVENLRKNTNEDFDYHSFNYLKVIYPKEDLEEIDFKKFKSDVLLGNLTLFNKEIKYKESLETKVYFKDFDFVLSLPIIHIVSEFINDNENRNMKIWVNKEDITKNIMIEVYSNDIINDEVINTLLFMPVATNNSYSDVIENGKLVHEEGTYQKNIEKLYSWSDMANELTDRGIPHEVVRNLADVQYAWILNRPVMSMFKFDDYLHEKYGDYESEGKSMHDMFKQIFGDDCDKIAYYFGIDKKE